jgi:hypothetical protein
MAIVRNFNGASLRKPGAYSKTIVNLSGGFPLAATGIIAILGEAEGGGPGSTEGVLTFTSEDIGSLIELYKSGPIVDAARILVAPAKDARVPNGASQIRIYKTNASTQATAAFANAVTVNMLNLTSKNWGEDENLIAVKIEAGANPAAKLITITKQGKKETLSENPCDIQMQLQYTGANPTATLAINNATKVATISAGADSMTISLANKTIDDLVQIIDNSPVFTASTTLKMAKYKAASDLDPITTAADIKTAAKNLFAQQKEIADIINAESELVFADMILNVEGTLANVTKKFLAGGAKGASTNSGFQAGFDALLAMRCNTVVPLISRDAADLIPEGLTDPSSTFDVASVNLQALTHCITASNTKNRSERNSYLSVKDTFAASQDAAQDLNHERASMLFQDVEALNSEGEIVQLDPWAAACMVAGIQAGTPVGTPATFKRINANGIMHNDYNSKTQIDLAIDAGLIPLEELETGGFRVVVQNSTYGVDPNFVYNRPSVLYAADYVAYNLRQQLEAIFIGEKAKTGTAEAIKNTVISIMSSFLSEEIIVGDDTNDKLGWKDLLVTIAGNTAKVDITITPVQGIDFVLATITLDDIRQSA